MQLENVREPIGDLEDLVCCRIVGRARGWVIADLGTGHIDGRLDDLGLRARHIACAAGSEGGDEPLGALLAGFITNSIARLGSLRHVL
jgi:hypothetical protein